MDNVTVICKSKLDINIDNISDYFIVVFKDLKNEYKMYFTEYDYNDKGLKITGTNPALDIYILQLIIKKKVIIQVNLAK